MINRTYVLLLAASSFCAMAYDPSTHFRISHEAADKSQLNSPAQLQRLGLAGSSIDSRKSLFPNSLNVSSTIRENIKFGSTYEDDRRAFQAIYHFYDPANGGRALTVSGLAPGAPSPDWALENVRDFGTAQPFSHRKARQYLYDALTRFDETERNRNWGLVFQTMGHVIHHLQDMAQPQHTRRHELGG